MHPTLTAHAIVKSFGHGSLIQRVIQPLSLAIHPGALTLVVGPSGSGKSTLLSMLSGLLRPDEGRVQALGVDLWNLDETGIDAFRMQHCGFIFQGFNLFASLTALENTVLPLHYQGVPPREAVRRAEAVLEEVGLASRKHLRPIALSGGEKQRVAIARALVKEPSLLFADEPTSALDGPNGRIVVELLKRIAHQHGATVLGVTHDPRLLGHADRVVSLVDGTLTADAPPSFTPLALEVNHAC